MAPEAAVRLMSDRLACTSNLPAIIEAPLVACRENTSDTLNATSVAVVLNKDATTFVVYPDTLRAPDWLSALRYVFRPLINAVLAAWKVASWPDLTNASNDMLRPPV